MMAPLPAAATVTANLDVLPVGKNTLNEDPVLVHTAGLWGDADTVQRTLDTLAEGLAGEWLLDEQDIAIVERMCTIALARQDLDRARRADLYYGVLRVLVEWLNGPTEHRRVAYPFLDSVATDPDLPAYLASSAHAVLAEQARACVRQLLSRQSSLPTWLPPADVLGPGLAGLLARIEWLELLRSALGLVQVTALGEEWGRTLVKLLNLAGVELAGEMERDMLLASQSEGYVLLAELLSQAWVTPQARAKIEPQFAHYLEEVRATMLLYETHDTVYRPIYTEIAELSGFAAVPAELRRQMKEFLRTHKPVEQTAGDALDTE